MLTTVPQLFKKSLLIEKLTLCWHYTELTHNTECQSKEKLHITAENKSSVDETHLDNLFFPSIKWATWLL